MMVKARSIDSTADAEQVFKAVLEEISKYFEIIKSDRLEPFHKEHIFIYCSRP